MVTNNIDIKAEERRPVAVEIAGESELPRWMGPDGLPAGYSSEVVVDGGTEQEFMWLENQGVVPGPNEEGIMSDMI